MKGFGLDKLLKTLYIWIKEYTPPPFPVQIAGFSAVAGLLLVGIGLYQGWTQTSAEVSKIYPQPILGWWVGILPKLLGWFIIYSIPLVVIGICILLAGRAIRWFFERDTRLWRTIVIVIVIAWSSLVFHEAAKILINPMLGYSRLVFTIVVSIIWSILAVLITSLLSKKYASIFGKEELLAEKEEQVEES
jgi:hypothetical protein